MLDAVNNKKAGIKELKFLCYIAVLVAVPALEQRHRPQPYNYSSAGRDSQGLRCGKWSGSSVEGILVNVSQRAWG